MFSRDWRYYLALGWLAPFVVLFGFATALVISGGDLLYCKQPDARGSNPSTEPEKVAVPKAANDKAHCRDQSAQRDNECQSWRQAEVAEDQACVARRQFYAGMFIGLLGLLGLGGTVVFTAQAAVGALKAATATEASAATADRTLKAMQTNTERQLRAYINVVEGNLINFDTECPVMQAVLKNFGQTPAHEVTVFQTGKIAERPLATTRLTINMEEGKRPFGVVGPGADFHLRLFFDEPVIPEGDKDVIRGGLAAIYWYGIVRYKDVFGSDWWTTFRVMYKQDVGVVDPEGSLAVCDEGNEAT